MARLVAVLLAGVLAFTGCSPAGVVRPITVPADAVYSAGGKLGGWWQYCTHDSGRMIARCTVWNARGEVLVDEDYASYDGRPVQRAELVVSKENVHAGGGYIRLENGRYLIPGSKFKEGKRFLDDFGRQ